MKRSAAPARKTPLKRTALKRSTTPIKRTGLKPAGRRSSPNRRAKQVDRDEIREQVFRRDGYRCRLGGIPGAGPCLGRLTFHHRRKDGQGGGYTIDNGACLCAGHNDRIEADADLAFLARTMGLVLKRGDVWTVTHERFWAMVDRDGPIPEYRPELGPCWIWRGALRSDDPEDYGKFRTASKPGGGGCEYVYPHRFALGCVEALVDGLEVDHLCRVRRCCNPRHLEQVTPAVNRERQALARRPLEFCRKENHPLTGDNLVIVNTKNGPRRECRECRAVRQRTWYEREKEVGNR